MAHSSGEAHVLLCSSFLMAIIIRFDVNLSLFAAVFAVYLTVGTISYLGERAREERDNDSGSAAGGADGERRRGVTEEAREAWKRYEWADAAASEREQERAERNEDCNYGSIRNANIKAAEDALLPENHSDDEHQPPCCSICLCNYVAGEDVAELTCGHVFHEPCVLRWTKDHVRCPLCNCNLMEGIAGR